jgi:hypothetical protein
MSAGAYSQGMDDLTPGQRAAAHHAGVEAFQLVSDVFDGGAGAWPVSREAVIALANVVIGQQRATAMLDGVTDEDEVRARIRHFIDDQLQDHGFSEIEAGLGELGDG